MTTEAKPVGEFDPEICRWSAVFPEIPSCATAGDRKAENTANAMEALALWLTPNDLPATEGV